MTRAEPRAAAVRLAGELRARLGQFPDGNTAVLRAIRRQVSGDIKHTSPEIVLQTALLASRERSDRMRFVVYELINRHAAAFAALDTHALVELGRGLNSWSSVDCFALYLSGPMWLQGRLADRTIIDWAHAGDHWWRRAALVSTVPLSRRGTPDQIPKVVKICALLAADREEMVVKALSWALREMSKRHPQRARAFLAEHERNLAARVVREVRNKLTTGLKTPRRVGRFQARSTSSARRQSS